MKLLLGLIILIKLVLANSLNPIIISQSIELIGSITKSTTAYTLKHSPNQLEFNSILTLGLKDQDQFIEFYNGKLVNQRKLINYIKLGNQQ